MQLELGQLIIDTTGGCLDTGVVIEIREDPYGDDVYHIYWVCPRNETSDYTTTLEYTQEELEHEYSHCFEVVELK